MSENNLLEPLVFELHHDTAQGKSGLIGSYTTADNPVFQALQKEYGDYGPNYSRDFRGGTLGGPSRGISFLEMGPSNPNFTDADIDQTAQRLYGTLMNVPGVSSGRRPLHFFTGHADVPRGGATGAPGEVEMNKALIGKLRSLFAGNSNISFYASHPDIEHGSDPRSNWSRGASILAGKGGGAAYARPTVDSSSAASGGAPSTPGSTPGSAPAPADRAGAKEKAQSYAQMSKAQLDAAYDALRSDPEKAKVEGMKMHKAFFKKA